MSLAYWIFDPSACHFPKPRVPILPSALACSVSPEGKQTLLDVGLRHFSRGRYALGDAYRLAGLDPQSGLLAPAYHCVTMIDPALALGAQVNLYALKSDLLPDRDSLERAYAQSLKPIKALLATHFFGFVRDFSWLKQWCEAKGVVFIEDCSHVLFTDRYQAKGAGVYGSFVASSPYKFFPSADGGLLYAPEINLRDDLKTESADFISEFRGIKNTIEKSRLPRISANDIEQIDQQLETVVIKSPTPGDDKCMERPAQSVQYSLAAARTASLRSSRWVISHSAVTNNITRRQNNYRRWAQALSDIPNCHALYPDIQPLVVPYMFPLYLDFPMPYFYWLKQLGLPVWRWDEMAVSNCSVAADYRLHLLHLPCHQSLSEDEMAWMVAAVRKTISIPAVGF